MRIRALSVELKRWILILCGACFIAACDATPLARSQPVTVAENAPTQFLPTEASLAPLIPDTETPFVAPTQEATSTPAPALEFTATEVSPTAVENVELPVVTGLNPISWMAWPAIPTITQHAREIYALGQALGNDPRALSVFGDCQGLPDVFLGPYILDPQKAAGLPVNLQETVAYFKDSLNRKSPTIKNGTTTGALLWTEWHENKYGCAGDEKPMDCELRLHKPSFVLIMLGTHAEGARDEFYMRKILDTLLARGVVPILSTKADNREGDHHINLQAAQLAEEYNIPLWNFFPLTSDLPNRGLYTKKIDRHLGDIYLTEEALELHRYSALQVLDAVWRAVKDQ
jgi:hypothetical protein